MKNTLLVTGGGGYIGSHMVHRLVEQGHHVLSIDDFRTGVEPFHIDGATLIRGSIGESSLLQEIAKNHRIGGVFHFAARQSVPESVAVPLTYYYDNVALTTKLLAAMVEYDWGPLVFSSTAAVYGAPSTDYVHETSPTVPISPYGWSKLMCERIIADASAAHQLPYTILRYFNAAGADSQGRTGQRNPASQHLITNLCRVATSEQAELMLYGTDYPTPDGTCVRDYIHVSDLIDAHVLAWHHMSEHGVAVSDTFNCGYGTGASVRELVATFEKITAAPIPVRECPRREGDAATLVASASKIRDQLGWLPRHNDLEQIARDALNWSYSLAAASSAPTKVR